MPTRRTTKRLAAMIGLSALAALGLAWLSAPEPPRVVFRAADAWSFGQGFAEGGRAFLTHGPAGTVVWDAETWRPRSTWPLLACPIRAISRDGRLGIGVHGHDEKSARVVVVDLGTGEVRHRFEAGLPTVALAAFADDDRTIRTCLADRQGFAREVASWDLATGTASRMPLGGPGPPGLQPVAVAPDGTTYAVLDYMQGRLHLWDARTGRAVGNTLQLAAGRVAYLGEPAFTPDGRSLLVGRDDGRVQVWDLATARLVRTLAVHRSGKSSRAIRVGPDGRTVVSTGSDSWNRSSLALFVDDLKRRIGISPRCDSEVAVVDLATGEALARWPGASRVLLAPDGRTFVTQELDGSFGVRDVPPPPPPRSR